MPEYVDLTDEQWRMLEPIIPEPVRRLDGRGRPWRGRREVLNGILYILRTGSTWADLPSCYPPYQTCHRRFQQWVRSGVMTRILKALEHQAPPAECEHAPASPELAAAGAECVSQH